ncbi:MAG: ArsR family transcriptional regulator [Gemmatimonadota bacterium]
MRWWEKQIGGKTRGRIIALLRRAERTVEEIAADLGVTDNAVRGQLQLLEREGLVSTNGTRPHAVGAGKPSLVYRVAPGSDAALSTAYAPVLIALLSTLGERLTPGELERVLREAGQRLAGGGPVSKSLEERVHAAAQLLTSLGAELDVEQTETGYRLRGYACPLAAAVERQPLSCVAIQELVASLTQADVRECCDRSNGARCRFEIAARSA